MYRTAWTSKGQPESVAAHTWRLCLMALVPERHFVDINIGKLLKMCLVHDLGEAIGGDIPARSSSRVIHRKRSRNVTIWTVSRRWPALLTSTPSPCAASDTGSPCEISLERIKP